MIDFKQNYIIDSKTSWVDIRLISSWRRKRRLDISPTSSRVVLLPELYYMHLLLDSSSVCYFCDQAVNTVIIVKLI